MNSYEKTLFNYESNRGGAHTLINKICNDEAPLTSVRAEDLINAGDYFYKPSFHFLIFCSFIFFFLTSFAYGRIGISTGLAYVIHLCFVFFLYI